jgi:hypothetical protein
MKRYPTDGGWSGKLKLGENTMDKCPVCKSDAQELEPGFFDGYTVKCPIHGEIEFSDSVRAARWNEPRAAWEAALTRARERALKTAQHTTVAGKRPRILDSDF